MRTFLFVLTLFFAQFAFAGADVSSAALTKQLSDLKAEYSTLQVDRAKLAKREDDLKWSKTQVDKQVKKYSAQVTTHNANVASWEARVSDHNSRCSGTYSDQSYVDSCNAEKSQLDSEGAQLTQEKADLDQTGALVQQAVDTQNQQVKLVWGQDKRDYDRMVQIHNLSVNIVTELKAIATHNDTCKNAIEAFDNHTGSAEAMAAACGKMFDGN